MKDSRVTNIHDSAGTMCMGAQSTTHPTPQCYYLLTTVWRECRVTWLNHQNQQNILVSGADIPEKTRNLHEDLMQDAQEQAVCGARWDS